MSLCSFAESHEGANLEADRCSLIRTEPISRSLRSSPSWEYLETKECVESADDSNADTNSEFDLQPHPANLTCTDDQVLDSVRAYFDEYLCELLASQEVSYNLSYGGTSKSRLFWTKTARSFALLRYEEQCKDERDLDPLNEIAGCSELAEHAVNSEHLSFLPLLFTVLSHQNTAVRPQLRLEMLYILANAALRIGLRRHPIFKICSFLDLNDSCEDISKHALRAMCQLSNERLGQSHEVSRQLKHLTVALQQGVVDVSEPCLQNALSLC